MSPFAVAVIPLILAASELISIVLSSTPKASVLPVFVRPLPAVTCPAPENCVNVSAEVPNVAVPVTEVRTYALSALAEPA